ncbi:MAG: hypothetical protein K6F32_01580 [Bacilli bacterium]|nr:hypothetical protein [Bacilli bacterium]
METTQIKQKPSEVMAAAEDVKRTFRRCLLDLGISPGCHIYDVPEHLTLVPYDSPQKEFCEKMHSAYDSMNTIEKIVCVKDLLEAGEHYRFWYYGIFGEKAHLHYILDVARKLCKAVGVYA